MAMMRKVHRSAFNEDAFDPAARPNSASFGHEAEIARLTCLTGVPTAAEEGFASLLSRKMGGGALQVKIKRPRINKTPGVNLKSPETLISQRERARDKVTIASALSSYESVSGTLFLANQAARDIDPAVGTNHTGDPDAILFLACRSTAKLKRRTFTKRRIGRLRLATPLLGAEKLGSRRDRQRRREHRRTKTHDRNTCHGIFKGLIP